MANSSSISPLLISSIKAYADLDAASLPSSYITRNPAVVAGEAIITKEIPIIDFSILRNGTPDQRSKVIHDIGRACEQWGCFTVVNHGVPESLRTAMMDEFVEFFDLTAEEKEVYMRNRVFEPIRCGTSFNSMVEGARYWRDFVRILVHPVFHSPDKPLNFRKVSEEFTRQTREIGKELSKAIYESLGLEESCSEAALQPKSFHQILLANLYPPCPQPELALGLPMHSDPFLLTIIMQKETVAGLQVMNDDKWVVVEPIPSSFFVLVGDIFEIISNGKYKSLLHRAALNNKSTRISVLSVIMPPLEALLAPSPQLVERDNGSPAFRVVTYKEFIEKHQRNQTGKFALDCIRL